jgi:hypothetical protein
MRSQSRLTRQRRDRHVGLRGDGIDPEHDVRASTADDRNAVRRIVRRRRGGRLGRDVLEDVGHAERPHEVQALRRRKAEEAVHDELARGVPEAGVAVGMRFR